MDGWIWYLICAMLIFGLYLTVTRSVQESYRRILYDWANVPGSLYGSNSVLPESLISGLRNQSHWLGRQGKLFGVEEGAATFERYFEAFKKGSDISESNQTLREMLERAHKLSLDAKEKGNETRFMQLKEWGANVATWAEVVQRFVPDLSKNAKLQPA